MDGNTAGYEQREMWAVCFNDSHLPCYDGGDVVQKKA